MKAITIRQPWATLIALGVKRYETRSRPTNVRGRIAIHAGLAMPLPHYRREDYGQRLRLGEFTVERWNSGLNLTGPDGLHVFPLPLGAVIATAELVDCIPTYAHGVPTLERSLGDWSEGRWAWQLDNVCAIEPIAAKGRQGWWEWEPRTEEGAA